MLDLAVILYQALADGKNNVNPSVSLGGMPGSLAQF